MLTKDNVEGTVAAICFSMAIKQDTNRCRE